MIGYQVREVEVVWQHLTDGAGLPELHYTNLMFSLHHCGRRLAESTALLQDEKALSQYLDRLDSLARDVPGSIRAHRVGVMTKLWALAVQDRYLVPRHLNHLGFGVSEDTPIRRAFRRVLGHALFETASEFFGTVARLYKVCIVALPWGCNLTNLAERSHDLPLILRIAAEGLCNQKGRQHLESLGLPGTHVYWRRRD